MDVVAHSHHSQALLQFGVAEGDRLHLLDAEDGGHAGNGLDRLPVLLVNRQHLDCEALIDHADQVPSVAELAMSLQDHTAVIF